jgi:hypothetical protein
MQYFQNFVDEMIRWQRQEEPLKLVPVTGKWGFKPILTFCTYFCGKINSQPQLGMNSIHPKSRMIFLCFRPHWPHVNFVDVVFAISFHESGKHGLLVLSLFNFMDNLAMSHKLCPC